MNQRRNTFFMNRLKARTGSLSRRSRPKARPSKYRMAPYILHSSQIISRVPSKEKQHRALHLLCIWSEFAQSAEKGGRHGALR